MSFVIPTLAVTKNTQDVELQKSQVQFYLILQAGFGVFVALATLFLFRDPNYGESNGDNDSMLRFVDNNESEIDTSVSTEYQNSKQELLQYSFKNVWEDIVYIMSKPYSIYLLAIFAITYGTLITFGSTAVAILESFGREEVKSQYLKNRL